MGMSARRWSAISESEFEWEREALAFLREQLPDVDPWHVWSNFEFIDDQGRVNEVDALVLSPRGLFLVEIKSRPGRVEGDAHSWTWTQEGRRRSYDNPYLLANRKSKRLKSLLQRQTAFQRSRARVPFVTALIFLSASEIEIRLPPEVAVGVFARGGRDPGIVAALSGEAGPARTVAPYVDAVLAPVVRRAMEEAGVRQALGHRRIGDYDLGRLIDEGDDYQDFEGSHAAAGGVRRRIRIFPPPATGSSEDIRRAVAREFQILEGINHPGIMRAADFKDTDRGPALIFEYDPRAIRLDFVLRERAVVDSLGQDQRLALVRQLAEIIRYAHGKRLCHRSLAPQNVLVRDPGESVPRLQVMNWQTAEREAGSTGGTLQQNMGTAHLLDYVDDPARVYLAPEALHGNGPSTLADVFSVGAIAYHLFCNQPPAATVVELVEKLRRGQGLLISDAMDGASPALGELIRSATHPDVSRRIESMQVFLDRLAEVERESAVGGEGEAVDPSAAKPGEKLDGGFVVVRKLGRGSSADALLVKRDGGDEELVIKVAVDSDHNDRIAAEGEVLKRLTHQNIVRYRETVTVAGRTALLMECAGDETLASRMRRGERPSLDLARVWGEDLIAAIDYLDEKGIAHRDIKPDNIGVTLGRRLHLVLFDFSLSASSVDNIQAGTRPYLDPFLSLRRPPRWDLQAERFAVAVTLYEMMTANIPVWGDGHSEPAVLDCEATLEAERLDPQVRDGLAAFFARALRRDPRERFDNAEEMLRAWRQVFDEAKAPTGGADTIDAIMRRATAQTPVADLGYGVEALDILSRMGVETVRQLLAVPRIKFRYLAGVGDRVRKEIRVKAKQLALLRPELVPGGTNSGDETATIRGPASIDRLAEMLLPRRPACDDAAEDGALAAYLGLEEAAEPWPTLGAVAGQSGLSRMAVTEALSKARQRWHEKPALTGVRADLAVLLERDGRVMTAAEAARNLLLLRGSLRDDDGERMRLAGAILRAAVEAEEAMAEPRFRWLSTPTVPLVAADAAAGAYAIELGQAADELAAQAQLPSPQRVRDRLQAIAPPDPLAPLSAQRLLRLAVAVSARAALSTRHEVYPRGMDAEAAIRLSLNALMAPGMLTPEQIAERVGSRYPEAAPLPLRPQLDALLRAAGAELVWRDDGRDGAGYYGVTSDFAPSGTDPTLQRLRTVGPAVADSPEVLDARTFEDRVGRAVDGRRFLAVTMLPRHASAVASELARRLPLTRIGVDALMLRMMKEAAAANEVEWLTVRETDSAGPRGPDWGNLKTLAAMAWDEVERRIRQAAGPVLLTDAGLIGRYGLIGRLDQLRADCGTPQGPPGLVAVLPMATPGAPAIDGVPVAVMPSEWAMVPEAWINNAHRAGRAA